MPIAGVEQPERIQITPSLRLRKYDGQFELALAWYQDEETLMLVNHSKTAYDCDRLKKMYDYLNAQGEQYFIEVLEEQCYRPIGDVTFSQMDMPIVIGEKCYRGKGIGKEVITTLKKRGRELGYETMYIEEIYSFNLASQKLFEQCGFEKYEPTDKGYRYKLKDRE